MLTDDCDQSKLVSKANENMPTNASSIAAISKNKFKKRDTKVVKKSHAELIALKMSEGN